jgi:hypothetical protein
LSILFRVARYVVVLLCGAMEPEAMHGGIVGINLQLNSGTWLYEDVDSIPPWLWCVHDPSLVRLN